MKRHAALLAFFVSTVVLLTGCFTSSQMAKLQMPANYAKSPTLEAKSSWRTAVLPPTGGRVSDPSAPGGLYDYAGMALMKKGRFTVVDRSAVDQLLEEQEFSYSGVVDAGTAARLGKMLGAEAVMIVNVTEIKHDDFWDEHPAQRDAELHLKIISVETSEVLYSAVGQGSDFDGASGALKQALEVALMPLGTN